MARKQGEKKKKFHVSIALCRAGGFWKLKVLFMDPKQKGIKKPRYGSGFRKA
jgi:hypothetical protein